MYGKNALATDSIRTHPDCRVEGQENYVFTWTDGESQYVRLYQDIGAETYLCIEILDYFTQYTVDDLVGSFCYVIG